MIEVKNLTKVFSYYKKEEGLKGTFKNLFRRKKLSKVAVEDISFKIASGEFVGFIGPNGAGKTTTLKILSGILYPTKGSVKVAGYEPRKREDDFKKKISIVMGQKQQLWPTLPALETFNLIRRIYEIPEKVYRKKLDELIDLMDVRDIVNIQARKLSLGQRMKCELIASLLHSPKILFLDEPTIGLDITSQKKIREFLRYYNKKNKTTIILTSHYMDDVEDLCDRLIIVNKGRIGYDGSLDAIVKEYSQDKFITIQFNEKVLKRELSKLGKVISFSSYESTISVSTDNLRKRIGELVNKFPVKDVNIEDVTLEEVVEDIFTNGNYK